MSDLTNTLKQDLISAMKEGNDLKKSVLRMVTSELKNAQIDAGEELDDQRVLQVLTRLAKQRKDSIASYQAGGRLDLVNQEQAELVVIEEYLPTQMSDEELRIVISSVVSDAETKDFGTIMKQVMIKVSGQADGNRVRSLVQEFIQ